MFLSFASYIIHFWFKISYIQMSDKLKENPTYCVSKVLGQHKLLASAHIGTDSARLWKCTVVMNAILPNETLHYDGGEGNTKVQNPHFKCSIGVVCVWV